MSDESYEPFSKLWSNGCDQQVKNGPRTPSYGRIDWDKLDSDKVLLEKSFSEIEEILITVRSYVMNSPFTYEDSKGLILPRVCSVIHRLHAYLSDFAMKSIEAGNETGGLMYLFRTVTWIINDPEFGERYNELYPGDTDDKTKSSESLDITDGETTSPSAGTTTTLTADDYPYRLIGFLSRSEAEHFVSDPNCPVISKAYLTQVRFTLEDYGFPTTTIKRVLATLAPEGPLIDVSH